MNNKRRAIRLATALILAIIGTVALMAYVKSAKDDAVSDEQLVDVYVVDELVPKGADERTIEKSVSIERVPARLLQEGAITDLADVNKDHVAAADLQPGDQLLEARLTTKAQVSDEVTDKVQISVRLAAERAVGGSLAKGDLVGVYLSLEPFEVAAVDPYNPAAPRPTQPAPAANTTASTVPPTQKTPNYTRMEFQHVLVTNVQTTNAPVTTDDDDDDDDDDPQIVQVSGNEYIVTLALSPEQSERFVFVAEFGKIWLSKDPATVSDDGTRLVTLGEVFTVVGR